MSESRDFSGHTARLIDEEIQAIIGDMEKKALETLAANRARLDTLTEQLLEHKTLSKKEVDKILKDASETAN